LYPTEVALQQRVHATASWTATGGKYLRLHDINNLLKDTSDLEITITWVLEPALMVQCPPPLPGVWWWMKEQ